jgi:polyisoprenoid-binding protein YceI
MKRLVVVAALALAALPALAQTSTWKLDSSHAHSSFTVRHLVISNVRGEFGKTEGTLVLDEGDVTRSKVDATIDVTSVNTREAKRDEHLKSPDFFDVAKFPKMTFRSTKVEKAGDGMLKVTGDLTLKGVTKSVVLDVSGPSKEIKDPWGNARRGIEATATINRQDFGLTWNKAIEAGPVVGDQVKIEVEAEFIKEAPKK